MSDKNHMNINPATDLTKELSAPFLKKLEELLRTCSIEFAIKILVNSLCSCLRNSGMPKSVILEELELLKTEYDKNFD